MLKRNKILLAAVAGMSIYAPLAGAATVADAVKEALSTNPEVQGSVNERAARVAELRQAKSGYYPTVNISAGVGPENTDSPYTRAAGNTGYVALIRREANINARENLFNGLATSNDVKRAGARLDAADFGVYGVMQRTALESVRAYLDVMRKDAYVELAKHYLAVHQRIYQQVRKRSEAGVARVADLEQVQGRLALAQSTVIVAQRELDDARANYLNVVGVLPADPMVQPNVSGIAMPSTLEKAEALALSGHPLIKAADANVAAAQAQYKAAGGSFYPSIDVVAAQDFGRDMDGLTGLYRSNSAMIEGRYNLFNGGGDAAKRREYLYRLKQAENVRDLVKRQVIENLRLAWNANEAAAQQLQYLQMHKDSSRKARDAYVSQFDLGRRSLLDLLDSEREVYEASRSDVSGVYEKIYTQYRVLAGMGTLLSTMNVHVKDNGAAITVSGLQR